MFAMDELDGLDQPVQSGALGSPAPRPEDSGLPTKDHVRQVTKGNNAIFWLSCCFVGLIYSNWYVYSNRINPLDPLPIISPDLLANIGTFILTIYIYPLVIALKKHKLAVFNDTANCFEGETYVLLSRPLVSVILFIAAIISYYVITTSPILELFYGTDQNRPTIQVDGKHITFNEHRIRLAIDGINEDIVIVDSYGLYRHRLDYRKSGKKLGAVYAGHYNVNIAQVLISRDFDVSFVDFTHKEHEVFSFKYSESREISDDYCRENSMPIDNCLGALQKIFQQVSQRSPELREDILGHITHEGTDYLYEYTGKQEKVALRITDTGRDSDLARNPEHGYELYCDSHPDHRTRLAKEFVDNQPRIPENSLISIYSDLIASRQLRTELESDRTVTRQRALRFISSVLFDSGHYLDQTTSTETIDLIRRTSLVPKRGTAESLVLAVSAICSLSRSADPKIQAYALESISSYFKKLGSDSNNIKTTAIYIILSLVSGESDSPVRHKVINAINIIHGQTDDCTRHCLAQIWGTKLKDLEAFLEEADLASLQQKFSNFGLGRFGVIEGCNVDRCLRLYHEHVAPLWTWRDDQRLVELGD